MKITKLLNKDTIILNLQSETKAEVIDELIDKLDSAGKLKDKKEYRKAILKREHEFSTGIGDGIAIPHAKTNTVKIPALAFGRSKKGIDYESLDGSNAHIFFMIAACEGAHNDHLETLSLLSNLLMEESFKIGLMNANSEEEVLNLIDSHEKAYLKAQNSEKTIIEEECKREDLVLAVTACPAGIAHTYMAASSLENKAKEMGVSIKVETNGSIGVKNRLTEEEISNATTIIIAADKQVEMARFEGKKVIQVPVVQAIKKPEELIYKGLKGDAPIYHRSEVKETSSKNKSKGFYKHIMNGVSNMLPFVIGGGMLIGIGFLLGVDDSNTKYKTLNSLAELLINIGGGNAFTLMVPVLAGFIGSSIADRPGFAPAMVGGFIAANNGAGFLGGVLAGFLGGYSVIVLKKVFNILPKSLEDIKPILIYPLFGILITSITMLLFIVNPVRTINITAHNWLLSISSINKIVLGLILGGMMAIDMGGPINKSAFIFGIAMIDVGNYYPSAAIMAAGMVPPIGIAMATTLFKNKFTSQERDAGKTNYILGISFITEGALPFAEKDPKIVIPSIMIGSATTGALSMIFNIGLPVPHGGIFVIPIVRGNPLLYLLAILIGSFITAFMLGIFKCLTKEKFH